MESSSVPHALPACYSHGSSNLSPPCRTRPSSPAGLRCRCLMLPFACIDGACALRLHLYIPSSSCCFPLASLAHALPARHEVTLSNQQTNKRQVHGGMKNFNLSTSIIYTYIYIYIYTYTYIYICLYIYTLFTRHSNGSDSPYRTRVLRRLLRPPALAIATAPVALPPRASACHVGARAPRLPWEWPQQPLAALRMRRQCRRSSLASVSGPPAFLPFFRTPRRHMLSSPGIRVISLLLPPICPMARAPRLP